MLTNLLYHQYLQTSEKNNIEGNFIDFTTLLTKALFSSTKLPPMPPKSEK